MIMFLDSLDYLVLIVPDSARMCHETCVQTVFNGPTLQSHMQQHPVQRHCSSIIVQTLQMWSWGWACLGLAGPGEDRGPMGTCSLVSLRRWPMWTRPGPRNWWPWRVANSGEPLAPASSCGSLSQRKVFRCAAVVLCWFQLFFSVCWVLLPCVFGFWMRVVFVCFDFSCFC